MTTTLPENVGVQIVGETTAREAIVAACDRAFGKPEFIARPKDAEGCPCGKRPASECDGEECRQDDEMEEWLSRIPK